MILKGTSIYINNNFDFENKSIHSNIKLLEIKIKDNNNTDLIRNSFGHYLAMEFICNLDEIINKKIILFHDMKNEYYEDNRESIFLELEKIKEEINSLSIDFYIEKELALNTIKNYSDVYIEELIKINKNIKEIEFQDCDECGSLMQYLPSYKGYCCSNEDCFEIKFN
jgi:hypothetical protein